MDTPYSGLPARAFWRSAVAEADPSHLRDICRPRFAITPGLPIATAGSCFAQNLCAPFRAAGLDVLDAEPAPRGLSGAEAARFGYGLFSARYGNIHTVRQFCQLLADARERAADPAVVWQRGGRFFDALRPSVEPVGLAGIDEVLAHRRHHLGRVQAMIESAGLVVFTLGLTETWVDADSGRVYPTAPGVIADPPAGARIEFHSHTVSEVVADLGALMAALRAANPGVRLLLTVSPVPLTATASGAHVLQASVASKAILRAAVADFVGTEPAADYFPSYEIVTNPAARGRFFAPNLRSVTAAGVASVMQTFLAAHDLAATSAPPILPATAADDPADDADAVICEEALLEAFQT